MLPNWNSTSYDNDDESVTASKLSSEMDTKRDILATKLQEAQDRRRIPTMWELSVAHSWVPLPCMTLDDLDRANSPREV